MDGVVATINVTTLGVHTLNVWMREDGMEFDKIVLTTDINFTPSGTGPAEGIGGDPNNYLSFEVDRNVTVYVAYDDDANAATRPAWLGNLGFVDTGQNVDVDGNAGADSYDLFSRPYNAGDTVMLGGNSAPPAVGHAMYFVIVVEN